VSCPEPDGQEEVDGRSAHDLFLDETGECPWCGAHDGQAEEAAHFEEHPEPWGPSLRAVAGSTSYEDYLARLAAEAGRN
jgi:hypothetical protein